MKEFDALKKDWRDQKPCLNENFDSEKLLSGSLRRLKKFEKISFRINLIKTIANALLISFLIWLMLFNTPPSAIKMIATVWLAVSIIIFVFAYWKVQLRLNKLNTHENSLDFIDNVLKNFSEQRILYGKKSLIFGAALIIGLNILNIDVLKDVPLTKRIGLHALVTIFMIIVIWAGTIFNKYKFKRLYAPIEKELLKIKEDLSKLFTE